MIKCINGKSIIILLLFVACTPLRVLSSQDFRFCFEHWYPYSYLDESGKKKGESIELLRKLIKEMPEGVSFTELPFAQCRQSVLAGEIPFILHTDPTEPISRINVPINDWRLTLAVSVNSDMTSSNLKDNAPIRVMIARTYGYPKQVMTFIEENKMKIIYSKFHTNNEAQARALFAKLLLGHVDAIIVDRVWAEAMRDKYSIPIRLLEKDIHIEPQYIGFHPSVEEKAQALKDALEAHFKVNKDN